MNETFRSPELPYLGYSDDVSVFLNKQILYRGRSAQRFRDPGFLGIVNPENDAVYLQLKKGRNELVLAITERDRRVGFHLPPRRHGWDSLDTVYILRAAAGSEARMFELHSSAGE